jgi:hypothetical protein
MSSISESTSGQVGQISQSVSFICVLATGKTGTMTLRCFQLVKGELNPDSYGEVYQIGKELRYWSVEKNNKCLL